MPCSICGEVGHNQRTCPETTAGSPISNQVEKRDRATVLRVDNMTEQEQQELHDELVKSKKRVTSNKARATLVEGSHKELPSRIAEQIEHNEEE